MSTGDDWFIAAYGDSLTLRRDGLDILFAGVGKIEVNFKRRNTRFPMVEHPGTAFDGGHHDHRLLARIALPRTLLIDAIRGDVKRSDLLMGSDASVILPDTSPEAAATLKRLALERVSRDGQPSAPRERRTSINGRNTPETKAQSAIQPTDAVAAAKAGGLEELDPATCRRLGRGRIHDIFTVVSGGETLVLQRVNEAAVPAEVLAQVSQRVFGDIGNEVQIRKWPRNSQMVLTTDSGKWLHRDFMQGQYLLAPVTLDQVQRMAAYLRRFHTEIKDRLLIGGALPTCNPWGESIDSDAVRIARTPSLISCDNELAAFAQLEAVRLRHQHYPAVEPELAVLHRDPKPSNFVEECNGNLALVDFDTVGPGAPMEDLGELVRAVVASDESPVETSVLTPSQCLAVVDAALRGYYARDLATLRQELIERAGHHARMLAQRFLAAHLEGNLKFKQDYPGENFKVAQQNLEAMVNLGVVPRAADPEHILVYAGAPNDCRGELSVTAKARLDSFIAIASGESFLQAQLLLTGGFGDHFNRSGAPHYAHAMRYLKEVSPAVHERISACLPSSHTYQDSQMIVWYARARNATRVTAVTSGFHAERLEFMLELHAPSTLEVSVMTGEPWSEVPNMNHELDERELRASAIAALTALLVGREEGLK